MKYLIMFIMVLSLILGLGLADTDTIIVDDIEPSNLIQIIIENEPVIIISHKKGILDIEYNNATKDAEIFLKVLKKYMEGFKLVTGEQHADIIKALEIGINYRTFRFFISEEYNGMTRGEWYKKQNDDFAFIQQVLKELKGDL